MATTKIWKVVKRLDHVVDYAKNENKKKNDYLENGFNKYEDIRQVVMYATNSDKTEKNNIPHKLTEEMRKDIAKMNLYSKLVKFLCKYKLELAENVDDLKDKKLREKQDILNTRNRLYYKRGNTENESEKDKITKQMIQVTEQLKKVKKLICVMRL